MKTAIYARLSRKDEDKIYNNHESRSIENQIKVLTDYADSNDLEITEIYYDDGVSGITTSRDGLDRMLVDAKRRKFSCLLIKDFSRLSRKLHHAADLITNYFPQNNIRVISINDRYDSRKVSSDDNTNVLKFFLNDYVYKDIRKKCEKSLQHRFQNEHVGCFIKYGYKLDENQKIVIDPYPASIIKRIFEMYNEYGPTKIAKILNEEKVLTKGEYQTQVLGSKLKCKPPKNGWTEALVRIVIKDYEYCGHEVNALKRDEQIILKNRNPPIISEELFYKANSRRIKQSEFNKSKINKLDFIYSKNGKKVHYYYKQNHQNFFYTSTDIYIPEEVVIEMLYLDVVTTLNLIKEDHEVFFNIERSKLKKSNKLISKSDIEKKNNVLNNKLIKILEDHLIGKISKNELESQSKKIQNEIAVNELKLTNISNVKSDAFLLEQKFISFLNTLNHLPEDKIALIKSTVSKVIISKNKNKEYNVTIKYKFQI